MVRLSCVLILGLVFSIAFAQPALAGMCAHGPCCMEEDITGPIIMPDRNVGGEDGRGDFNLPGFSVLSGVLAIGQGLRDGSSRTAGALDKNVEGQDAYIRQVVTGLGVSREKMTNMRMFGPDSRAYNTFSSRFGAGTATGFAAREQLSAQVRHDLNMHSRQFNSSWEILQRLQSAPDSVAFADTMSPRELAASKEVAKTILDPYPARNLTEQRKEKPHGERYNAIRKAKASRLLLSTAVLGDLIAARAPVMDLDGWPGQAYDRMGGEGDHPRAINGELSTNGMLSVLTDMRFANQDWTTGEDGIHAMTDAGVLRELLLSRVDKLMVEYQKLLWLDRMAALMAQKQLSFDKEVDIRY